MIQATPHMRVLVSRHPVDFRKGIDGMVRLCREDLQKDPFSGALFIFRNRRKTAIKILVYDGQGFWLCHKRLSKGAFRWWPTRPQSKHCYVDAYNLHALLAAGNPKGVKGLPSWREINSDDISI